MSDGPVETRATSTDSSQAPEFAELDLISRTRLRRLAEQYLDPTPALEYHLDLVDARGAWYAEHVIGKWRADRPDAFWALVDHYVRTHMPDRGTLLDLGRWVAAGAPERPDLLERWEDIATTLSPDTVAAAGPVTRAEVAHMDGLVAAWPEDLWSLFWQTYVHTACILRYSGLPLPAVTD